MQIFGSLPKFTYEWTIAEKNGKYEVKQYGFLSSLLVKLGIWDNLSQKVIYFFEKKRISLPPASSETVNAVYHQNISDQVHDQVHDLAAALAASGNMKECLHLLVKVQSKGTEHEKGVLEKALQAKQQQAIATNKKELLQDANRGEHAVIWNQPPDENSLWIDSEDSIDSLLRNLENDVHWQSPITLLAGQTSYLRLYSMLNYGLVEVISRFDDADFHKFFHTQPVELTLHKDSKGKIEKVTGSIKDDLFIRQKNGAVDQKYKIAASLDYTVTMTSEGKSEVTSFRRDLKVVEIKPVTKSQVLKEIDSVSDTRSLVAFFKDFQSLLKVSSLQENIQTVQDVMEILPKKLQYIDLKGSEMQQVAHRLYYTLLRLEAEVLQSGAEVSVNISRDQQPKVEVSKTFGPRSGFNKSQIESQIEELKKKVPGDTGQEVIDQLLQAASVEALVVPNFLAQSMALRSQIRGNNPFPVYAVEPVENSRTFEVENNNVRMHQHFNLPLKKKATLTVEVDDSATKVKQLWKVAE